MLNKKLPVSVAMVVYNEEDLIRRALESCADIVDDIVIVHDGPCKDRTLKIAREYTKNIFVLDHVGAPEPHRPFSFKSTRNNWVIQLDADEYLDITFRNQLKKLIQKDIPGYTVNWIEETGNSRVTNMTKEVLFQKNRVYFLGTPMEYVKPSNPKEKLVHASVGLVNAPKVGNYESWEIFTGKYRKFIEIQAQSYARPFSMISTWNYQGKDWDRNTKLKIEHPILLGVIGMNAKYILELVKKVVGVKTPSSLRSVMHQMWYTRVLYWRVFQIRHNLLFSKLISYRKN